MSKGNVLPLPTSFYKSQIKAPRPSIDKAEDSDESIMKFNKKSLLLEETKKIVE